MWMYISVNYKNLFEFLKNIFMDKIEHEKEFSL